MTDHIRTPEEQVMSELQAKLQEYANAGPNRAYGLQETSGQPPFRPATAGY